MNDDGILLISRQRLVCSDSESVLQDQNKPKIPPRVLSAFAVQNKRGSKHKSTISKERPPDFTSGYIIELDKTEWDGLKSKFSTSIKGGKVKLPTAFPEKGLYMLATILKSPKAVQATGNH